MSVSEGRILARYLLGEDPGARVLQLYDAAIRRANPRPVDDADARVLAYALAHPWSVGPLDAALALAGPRGAALRRRLLIMTAVLEVLPEYSDRFLARVQRGVWFSLTLLVTRAAFKALVGLGLLKVARR